MTLTSSYIGFLEQKLDPTTYAGRGYRKNHTHSPVAVPGTGAGTMTGTGASTGAGTSYTCRSLYTVL